MESHLKNHGMDLRVYEKRLRNELDVIYEAFNEIEIENGGEDDDEFGSVFEDDGEEEELLVPDEEEGHDPLHNQPGLPSNNYIQSPEDIDDIDIEENVDHITSDSV